ncbi:MAG TPA: ACP phosphodiesterase [Bacteroidales bacterium]|nr:ACP phosphodiesterase [Bacteroidales bacterium]
MNYLAHAYLSFNHEPTLVGNMISDFVKGKQKFNYSIAIQQGIMLHRAIDTFTDYHAATYEAKQFFKPVVGLYAGAFVDVVYDHFLAIDASQFPTNEALNTFAQNTYLQLQNNIEVMPLKFSSMMPYMQQQNWLYNYQFIWGIEKSLEGLVRRAKYLESSKEAFEIFQQQYTVLQQCYTAFFTDVKKMAFQQFEELQKL